MADKFEWVDVSDSAECPDCKVFAGTVKTMAEWDQVGGPRTGRTRCGSNCRCSLVKVFEQNEMTRLQQELDRLTDIAKTEMADKLAKGLVIDMKTGGKVSQIILKKYSQIKGIYTIPFSRVAYHDELIGRWKIRYNNKKLPNDFYDLNDIEAQIRWLKNDIGRYDI